MFKKERIQALVDSKMSVKVRVCELLPDDVVLATVCSGPLYVAIQNKELILMPILIVNGHVIHLVAKTNSHYKYGIKCQMWVDKKVIIK